MDHPSELPASHPWRSAALVAATVATLELLVLVIVGVAVAGRFFADEVEKANDPVAVTRAALERNGQTSPGSETSSPGSARPRSETSVLVLNGNGVAGAAARAADELHGHRYLVAGTGNAPRTDFARSVVMFRPGFEAEASRLARDTGVRRVGPLDGLRARDLQGAHLALVVGG